MAQEYYSFMSNCFFKTLFLQLIFNMYASWRIKVRSSDCKSGSVLVFFGLNLLELLDKTKKWIDSPRLYSRLSVTKPLYGI